MKERFTTYLYSPLGFLEISGTETHVTSVLCVEEEKPSSVPVPDSLLQCKRELEEYFAGKRKKFEAKLKPEGTDFQKSVWGQLKKLKYGDTTSYMEIAKELENPGSVRAVGAANGKNPIAIIIPCHRVIGGNGSLTGYAGGMWRKQWLLEHEGNVSGKKRTLF